MKVTAASLFPISPEKLEKMSKQKASVPMKPDIIKVAPKNFVVTICEKHAAVDFVKDV